MSLLLLLCLLPAAAPPAPSHHFLIEVYSRSGRGVPLVELRTVHGIRLFTDSAGLVAFHEPGLMDVPVFFYVSSPGHEFAPDGFGIRGRALRTTPGTRVRLQIQRVNIAERLYRVTGAGIYRDTILVGRQAPLRQPLLNGQVFGSDSVLTAVHRGKLYWFWGDTLRPSYPLGNFHVSGAISDLPGKGGLTPDTGVDLHYFVDASGFARQLATMPGGGLTWLTSVFVLPDENKRERLYAGYVKVKPPLNVYARGVAVFDDDRGVFENLGRVESAGAHLEGHTFLHREGGRNYIYFSHPYPLVRVPASPGSLLRPEDYEAFTCLKQGSRLEEPEVERDERNRPVYAWKKNTPPAGPAAQAKLIGAGKLRHEEALLQLRDRDTGKLVQAHSGSVYFNPYRQRWVLITVQHFGHESLLGEVWYAEADQPTGPWAYAVKVASHPRYSFYNPKQHPMFDQDKGRLIYFEGTYTHTFSGNSDATPRYDYNQLMYRLDLADERLALPLAVRDTGTRKLARDLKMGIAARPAPIAFFALDRPRAGTVAVVLDRQGRLQARKTSAREEDVQPALFHALPATMKDAPPGTVLLYARMSADGQCYSLDAEKGQAICRVWRSPWTP